MSTRTRSTLNITAFLVPVLVFAWKHRAVIAFVLEVIPDILRYAADPPPEDDPDHIHERDVTPAKSKTPTKPRRRHA